MVKLTAVKPSLPVARATIAYAPQGEREYDRSRNKMHWRKWYNTARWKKLRWSVLVRDLFTCQRCHKIESNSAALVGDHIKAHRGDENLFWDANNIETLCKPCHDGAKQREERSQR